MDKEQYILDFYTSYLNSIKMVISPYLQVCDINTARIQKNYGDIIYKYKITPDKVIEYTRMKPFIIDKINNFKAYSDDMKRNQSNYISPIIYYILEHYYHDAVSEWPLTLSELEPYATDIGYSLEI